GAGLDQQSDIPGFGKSAPTGHGSWFGAGRGVVMSQQRAKAKREARRDSTRHKQATRIDHRLENQANY
ncbi:MAG TPA: hypothetical protein P5055_21910, partial [Candidatus Paceibacterota bacterium]|nr:hypothetical protein [Candidatus Paceibacterota bacterium]